MQFRPKSIARAVHSGDNPFNVLDMEEGMADIIHNGGLSRDIDEVANFSPPLPLPEYVKHADTADQVTRLTSEVVIKQFEYTAKQVDAMGNDLKAHAVKLEQMLVEIDDELKRVAELAQHIRDQGKRKFEEVQHTSQLTADIRQACDAMRDKINTLPTKE